MSHIKKDAFDDAELTLMAVEIITDWATKAHIDPTVFNPFSYLFPADIVHVSVDNDKRPSLSPSLSLENTATVTDDYMVYLNYPSMAPQIVSGSKLLPNDSFNQSLPPIPTEKKAVNGWTPRNLNTTMLPYIPPPNVYIDVSSSDNSSYNVISCISPRSHTKKRSESHSQIPDFGEKNEININVRIKHKPKKRNKKKHKKKTYNKYTVKRVISPICIDFDRHKQDNDNQQNKNMKRKNRASSVDINMNEYAVEFGNGYMFVNNRNESV